MNHLRLVRCSVALIACAVSGHLVFKVTTFVLRAVLTPMLGTPDTWPDRLDMGLVAAAILLGLRVAFGIFRRLWPEQTVQEMKAREAEAARRSLAD